MAWQTVYDWFFGLGENYGVDPMIFGAIYVGAIPFFSISIGWLIRNYRRGKSIVFPALMTLFFFISAYIYLIVAGKNVPVWVYGIVVLLVLFGIASTIQKIKKQLKNAHQQGS